MILAGTGHRPDRLGGYGKEVRTHLKKFLKVELQELQPKLVIQGMALGFDQALGWACVELEIPLVAAIPFKGQENLWPYEEQTRYRELLKHAIGIHFVCDPGYAAWKMHERNKWMVDQLKAPEDRMLTIWDGSLGGTANCIKYARSKNILCLNLWKRWQRWRRDEESLKLPF